MISGTVADDWGRPLPQSNVKINQNGRIIASTNSDSNGHYQLFVLPNDDYILQASHNGYFNFEQEIPVVRTTERLLINSLTQNIQLFPPYTNPIILNDIFGQGTDIQLSTYGTNALKPTINTLRDNPQIKATFTLYYDKTDDENFNNTLIEQRINALHVYLSS